MDPLDEAEEYFLSNQRAQVPSNVKLAVTTLVLNQGRYLREWIEFHGIMGFDFFLIFDHGSTDDTLSVLSKFIQDGRVMLIDAGNSFGGICKRRSIQVLTKHDVQHPQDACQRKVFNFARRILTGKTVWMGNFDVDEFFWVPRQATTTSSPGIMIGPSNVLQVLDAEFSHLSFLQVVGPVFGTNEIQHAVLNKTVIETYTRRASIIPGVSDHGRRFGRKALYRPEYMSYVSVHSAICILCTWAKVEPLSSQIRMNHYQFKSREEQKQKEVINGNDIIRFNPSTEGYWNAVHDTEILYLLPELKWRLDDNNNSALFLTF